MNKQNKFTSEDLVSFLLNAYFGDLSAPLHVAVDSAYLDLCRTIQFKTVRDVTDDRKAALRSEAVKIIEESINCLGKKDIIDQVVFDEWHTDLCRRIILAYKDSSVPFYFGQAQKWVNMSLKYLSVIMPEATASYFEFMHVPIDLIVIKTAADDFEINIPASSWSRMDENAYNDYQNNLRSVIVKRTGLCPMLWEFRNQGR